jgi:hypothetical protein
MDRASDILLNLNRKPITENIIGNVQNEFEGRKMQNITQQIKRQRKLIFQQISKQHESKI